MSEKKAKCYQTGLNRYQTAYRIGAYADAYRFDCMVYHPGKARDSVCKLADRYSDRYYKEVMRANEIWVRCHKM